MPLSRRRFLASAAPLALAAALLAPPARAEQPELLVFAASSLTNALEEIGPLYTKETGQPVKFSFAASSALARQLEAGARADAFLSADLEWMDYA
ncbi:MAG: molybdate ABC transporter substrate-binding protein, partial [Myxococcota bacterium]